MTDQRKPLLPHGWIVKQSSTYPDRVYYFNVNTGNSTWEVPKVKSEEARRLKEANARSSLSKPGYPKQTIKTSVVPEPQFSPDIDNVSPESNEDDFFDLNDDGQAEEGHKYHMDILHRMDSPNPPSVDDRNKPDKLPSEFVIRGSTNINTEDKYSSSLTLKDQLACLQDVDMRRIPPQPSYTDKISGIPNNMSIASHTVPSPFSRYSDHTIKQQNVSAYTANTINNSQSNRYGEQTLTRSYSGHSFDTVDGNLHKEPQPLLHVTPNNSYIGPMIPHTPSDYPSFNLSEKDMSSSFQTLPSVHSNVLPAYHKMSSTPIEKRNVGTVDSALKSNMKLGDRFSQNAPYMVDVDFRITKQVERVDSHGNFGPDVSKSDRNFDNFVVSKDERNTQNYAKVVSNNDEHCEDRKRKNNLWKSQKEVKKLKYDNTTDKCGNVNIQTINNTSPKAKVLGANDLRHKVPRKEDNQNNNMNKGTVKRSSINMDPRLSVVKQEPDDRIRDLSKPFIPKKKIKKTKTEKDADKTDIRRVISRNDNTVCASSDFKSENISLRDRSPVDSDGNNVADSVHIDPDKLLSIQTWIDNLQPGPSSFPEEEEDLRRTSPDSGVLSITYSNDSDNRRIVVTGEKCGRTVDSGISSVTCSTNTVFKPIVEPWQAHPTHPPQIQQNNCWRGVHAQGAVVDHNRDVMDMEIDEVQNKLSSQEERQIEEMEVVDIVVKEVRESLKGRCTEIVGMLTEMISADTNTGTFFSDHKGLFIIVDTNILIDHLNFITDLRDSHIPCHGKPVLVFPWVVMQELDYLKSGKTASASMSLMTAKKARDAVQFLFHCLQSSHPRIIGQTPTQASLAASEFVAESNDDRVIQCCLQCQNNNQDCLVVLLTNDKNLCNKALIMEIRALTQQNLLTELPTLEGFVKRANQRDKMEAKSTRTPSKRTQPVESNNQTQAAVKHVESDEKFLDDVYCKVKSVIQESFSVILEREMRAIYDDIWLSIVYRKPPWALKDVLECFKKHWIAVFGSIYNRSLIKCVENLLDKIFRGCTVNWSLVEEIITSAVSLLDDDLKHKSYNNESARFVKELLDLKSCCFPKNVNISNNQNDRRQKCTSPVATCTSKGVGTTSRNFTGNRKSPRQGTRKSPVQDNRKSPIQETRRSPYQRKRNSSAQSNRKSPTAQLEIFSKSEIKLQQIWQTIDTFCAELNSVANESDSPERHAPRLLQMGEKIVPAIKDLQYHYSVALSIPPSETRSQLGNVIGLCDQLNNFLATVEIEDTEGPIETFDLLDLFAADNKREILAKGHVQLKEFIKTIFVCLQQLPDDSD